MRPFGLLLGSAGAVLGLAAEWVEYGPTDPVRWIPDLLVGWGFIACGLIGVARQPNSRTSALMAATGFTWFLGNFAGADVEPLAWVAANGIYLHRETLVHLILSYPSGRLSSRPAHIAVAAGYAAALIPPLWDSGVAAFALSLLVVGVSTRESLRALGRQRRARLLAMCAAVAFGLALSGGAAARLALPPGVVGYPVLLAYQLTLGAIAVGMLMGLVSASWERAEITDLVVELGSERSGTLAAALARALDDPSLKVGYWYADADAFIDSEGRVLSLPDAASGRSVTLVERDGAPIAVIVHDPAVLDDPGLRKAVASATRLAASNARLQADVQARVVELGAS